MRSATDAHTTSTRYAYTTTRKCPGRKNRQNVRRYNMGWASKQLWIDLARLGIFPIGTEPRKPLEAQQPDEEYRCKTCKQKTYCPAYDTGVCYPCPYYKEDDHGEK